jgi:hypothetical protein
VTPAVKPDLSRVFSAKRDQIVITAKDYTFSSCFKLQNLLRFCVETGTTMNRENLWIIGVLLIVFGGSLFGLFMLSNEGFYYFGDLSMYTIGFLITGLIASIFGFLVTLTCLDRGKADNTTKIRIVLIAMIILYLPLIGYLMTVDQEWTVRALIIESFQPSFGFYETFTLSSYSVLFGTLLAFGIFVLPFAVNEIGILNHHPSEPFTDYGAEGQTIEAAEDSFTRFVAFLKRRLGPIKNYVLPVGITLVILGCGLVGLPRFIFIDGPLTYDPEVEIWFIKDYKGFIRGKLLLFGLLFLVTGLVLIGVYIRRRRNSADKEKLKRSV